MEVIASKRLPTDVDQNTAENMLRDVREVIDNRDVNQNARGNISESAQDIKPMNGNPNLKKSKKPKIVNKDGTFADPRTDRPAAGVDNSYTFFIDSKCHVFYLTFVGAYVATGVVFAFLYLLVALRHKDIEDLYGTVDDNREIPSCFAQVTNFNEALSFSVETQSTIGYGNRYPEDLCPDAILLVIIQHMVATFLQTLFLAMMFARMTGPNKVDQKVYVSKDALITLRNGKLYLTFRVYYIWNDKYDRGAAAVAYCVMDTVTEADRKECLTRCRDIREIPVGFTLEGQDSNIPLITPTLVSHCIDKTSPLYNMDPHQLKNSNIEIIVCLAEKHTETGVDINIRTSFAADEIIWGARFNLNRGFTRRKRGNMLSFADDDINEWELDENTPKISAMALESKNQGIQE